MTGDLAPLLGDVRPHAHLRISKFSQHFIDVLDLTMTPLDYFLQLWPDMSREDGRKFLGRYGISGNVQTQIMSQLSDGQKSRVVLAKMAKENPHLLFLDEPTNHLDMVCILFIIMTHWSPITIYNIDLFSLYDAVIYKYVHAIIW